MSDIPPPLQPTPPPPESSDTLYLPFLLADAPRLQLDYLSRHKALPEAHREAIREWLRGYNTRMAKWLHDHYGPEAVRAANELSLAAARKITKNQQVAQEKFERELFNRLEDDLRND